MKQVIPFKKELLFDTKISEITSISLEHTLSLKDKDLISGNFIITGDYKMTNSSINRENFNFKLPYDIELDKEYEKDSIVIDIDNFYYEVINNEILKINIDVFIEGTPIENEEIMPTIEPEIIHEEITRKEIIDEEELDQEIIEEKQEEINNKEFNLFENIDNSETYVTYHVYIVKEEDTVDKIIEKYKVSKEDISLYNNIEEIKKGTKLIIPSNNE